MMTRMNDRHHAPASETPRRDLVLNDTSKRIIALLQSDGRMSYASIAKEVGLSEAAVRQRVQKLLEGGVMQIVAVTDPVQMGFARQAMVGISVTGDPRSVARELAVMDELDYVVITAGRFDILAELVVENDDDVLDIIGNRIGALPGVTGTETFLYLRLEKQTYAWGVR